jgi:hypothetical protein
MLRRIAPHPELLHEPAFLFKPFQQLANPVEEI